MKLRAAIFDVYDTLLEVGPPPKNADVLWRKLFEDRLGAPPPFGRVEFFKRASRIVVCNHAAARARGIRWPEIVWPAVVAAVLPRLARLSARQQADFILRQMQISHTLRLAPHAASCIRELNERGVLLGIASNSQAYTLRELDGALKDAGLNLSMFDPELRFWSFEHGFSKPDPHVFRILDARLEARGISPAEALMVGDRLDKDIAPARLQGFVTWWLDRVSSRSVVAGGDWKRLAAWLRGNV